MATEKISTSIIADDAVTNAKIGADAVSTTEIANDASISTSGNITTSGVITSPIIQTDSIKDDSGTRVLASDSGSAWSWGSGVPANTIINVTSLTRTSTDSHTTTTPKEITGLTHTISNPKSGSKFLLTGVINLSWDSGATKGAFFITRTDADGEVTIALGDQYGSNRLRLTNYFYIATQSYSPIPLAFNFLDSPNTSSSVVYKFKFCRTDASGTVYVNRGDTWNDGTNYATTISTTTIFEVAQ